ncbi:hypothetical protein [Streptosporangium sp. KLBMP 9127]|nr:hypothetical protein [Streptosporangium sp. KLBMP 9127]
MRGLIALAVAAVLATGCAASGGERPFVPADGPPGSKAPAAAITAPATPKDETLSVGRAMKVVFERPAGLDEEQTKMVDAYRDFYVGSWKAVATRGRDEGYLSGVEPDYTLEMRKWAREFVRDRRSVRGTARLYSADVIAVTGTGAQVDVCVDESGLRMTDATTGQEVPDQPAWTRPPRSTYLQSAALHRGDDGAWRIRKLMYATLPEERAKGCKR